MRTTTVPQDQQARFDRLIRSGFHDLLGVRLVEWSPDRAVIELDVTADHLNRSGVVHGGVLSTLMDVALGFSGLYHPEGVARKSFTLSLTTTFVASAGQGTLRAVGCRRGGGRQVYLASGEVQDTEGRVLALGEGSYRLRSDPIE